MNPVIEKSNDRPRLEDSAPAIRTFAQIAEEIEKRTGRKYTSMGIKVAHDRALRKIAAILIEGQRRKIA